MCHDLNVISMNAVYPATRVGDSPLHPLTFSYLLYSLLSSPSTFSPSLPSLPPLPSLLPLPSFPPPAGVLSLLKESEDEIKVFALQRLNELVDDFWAEISEDVSKM